MRPDGTRQVAMPRRSSHSMAEGRGRPGANGSAGYARGRRYGPMGRGTGGAEGQRGPGRGPWRRRRATAAEAARAADRLSAAFPGRAAARDDTVRGSIATRSRAGAPIGQGGGADR